MTSLAEPQEWRRQLGFLPVPLFGVPGERQFVMLNGAKGNFCLDVDAAQHGSSREAGALSWSADVDHYLSIGSSQLTLVSWDAPGRVEEYKLSLIQQQLEKFQQFLEGRRPPRDRSVVAHAIGTFRSVRAHAKHSGYGDQTALLAFLGLLIEAWRRDDGDLLSLEAWSEAQAARDAFNSVLGKPDQEQLVTHFARGGLNGLLSLSPQLLVRHAVGRIFQEAHYLTVDSAQGNLFAEAQAMPQRPASGTLGAFFTPAPLARTVVEQSLAQLNLKELSRIHVFDPACGSAEFLREAVRQLSLQGYDGYIQVTGFDVSESACTMARFALAAEAPHWGVRLQVEIVKRDAFDEAPWPKDVDLCLMNPPFVSLREMAPAQLAAVQKVLLDLAEKRPDFAMAFLRSAVDSLRPGGVLGTVLPASLLDGQSAQPLRAYLAEKAQPRLIARLGSQQVFQDALVDPALLVMSANDNFEVSSGGASRFVTLLWADHQPRSSERALRELRKDSVYLADARPEANESFSLYEMPAEELLAKDWAPRPYSSIALLRRFRHAPRVGELFDVKQGVITGLNSVMLLSDAELQTLPRAERSYFRRAVINSSFGYGHIANPIWVFYPHGRQVEQLATEDDLSRRLSVFYESHLLPNRAALLARARKDESNWWHLSEHRRWQTSATPKIVTKYFGTAGAFALDLRGEFVVVQGYAWLPRKFDTELLNDKQGYALIAALNAPITGQLLAGISNNVAGGQWNLSKRFIESLPCIRPDPDALGEGLFEELASYGQRLTDGRGLEDEARLNDLTLKALRLSH